MTAKEYYNNQDRFDYFTKLTNTGISDDFDEIIAFAEAYHEHKLKLLGMADVVGRSEQLSCGRNITTCVFYKDGGKCSNPEYCRDQTT